MVRSIILWILFGILLTFEVVSSATAQEEIAVHSIILQLKSDNRDLDVDAKGWLVATRWGEDGKPDETSRKGIRTSTSDSPTKTIDFFQISKGNELELLVDSVLFPEAEDGEIILEIWMHSPNFKPWKQTHHWNKRAQRISFQAALDSIQRQVHLAKSGKASLPSTDIRSMVEQLKGVVPPSIIEELELEELRAKNLEGRGQQTIALLVPAYIYPSDAGAVRDPSNVLAKLNDQDWKRLISGARRLKANGVSTWVVINPSSGPGSKVDVQYTNVIKELKLAGAQTIGYVSLGQGYGADRQYESLENIKTSISGWLTHYPQVDAFFFDTCPTEETEFAKVSDAASFAKSFDSKRPIFINPGRSPHEKYLNCKEIDAVCLLETNQGTASVVNDLPASRAKLVGLLWESDPATVDKEVVRLRELGMSFVYVTDRNDSIDLDGVAGPDPSLQWGRLPSPPVWNKLIESLVPKQEENTLKGKRNSSTKGSK